MDIRRQFWMVVCAVLFVYGGTVTAQEVDKDMPGRQEKHYKPVPLSPEKSARHTTDRMDSLLDLTKKQYDKLYKLNLKWAREDAENKTAMPRTGGRPEGAPDFGRGASDRNCTGTVRPKAWTAVLPAILHRQATGKRWRNSARSARRN